MIRDDDDLIQHRRNSYITMRRASEAVPRTITIGGDGHGNGNGSPTTSNNSNTRSHAARRHTTHAVSPGSPGRERLSMSLSNLISPRQQQRRSLLFGSSSSMQTPHTADGNQNNHSSSGSLNANMRKTKLSPMQSPIKRMSAIFKKNLVWGGQEDDGDEDDQHSNSDEQHTHENSHGRLSYRENDQDEDEDDDDQTDDEVDFEEYISPSRGGRDVKGIEEKDLTLLLLCRELELVSD
mmetsp:Transcript_8563/g.24632  ORF Transcript_8563/g.24632 Transcript_8563/m.24632 type:complete len:237 (-) Transcript_8563:575-1285(-)